MRQGGFLCFRCILVLVVVFCHLPDECRSFQFDSRSTKTRRNTNKPNNKKSLQLSSLTTATTTTMMMTSPNGGNRQTSRRWNGNYKHASKALQDVRKSKKLKLNLTANGITKTLEKKREESLQHVLTKAVIWKLFMDEYPNIEIELDIGDPNYLPDVISLDPTTGEPLFWGESGRMKVHKAVDLLHRYPNTHIVHCRWGMEIEQFAEPLEEYLQEQFDEGTLNLPSPNNSGGKFVFCSLPLDVWRFIDEETMTINISKEQLPWKELKLPTETSSR